MSLEGKVFMVEEAHHGDDGKRRGRERKRTGLTSYQIDQMSAINSGENRM
jgi:hypothetical protein